MTNYERIKAMSLEDMAAFVEAAGRNTCHKICVYRQGGENCKKMPCETGIKHWLESESVQTMRLIDADKAKAELLRIGEGIDVYDEYFNRNIAGIVGLLWTVTKMYEIGPNLSIVLMLLMGTVCVVFFVYFMQRR